MKDNSTQIAQKILDFLVNSNSVSVNDIMKYLRLEPNKANSKFVSNILSQLLKNKLILKNSKGRYFIAPKKTNQFQGTIEITGDVGIIKTNNKRFEKIIIRRRNFNTALDGDEVLVKLLAQQKNKKPRGEVIKIINRAKTQIFGTIEFDGDFYFLVPDDPKYYIDFLIPKKYLNNAKSGDKVSARFISWDNPNKSPIAKVEEILGKTGNPEAEFNAVLKEFDLNTKFNEEIAQEIAKIRPPQNRKYSKRLDLRNELVITIDPEDARDFDDALSLKVIENGNYQIGIHIADVSNYVKEDSPTDIEARLRGTSVYLVDRVVPMLPEKLSNEICSLQEGKLRFTYSVIAEVTPSGKLVDYQICESVIINKRRYNYNEVQQIIETGQGDNADLILELNKLAKLFRKKRFQKGGINFHTTEYKFILDENKFPIQVFEKRSTDATELVEEFMLFANKIVAQHIKVLTKKYGLRQVLPFLYRVHDEPDGTKIREILAMIKSIIKKDVDPNNVDSKILNKYLKELEGRPEETTVNQLLIRSMAKAEYSHQNIGHYGLGFVDYTHFTSPIRRYPDLVVHRLLKEFSLTKPSEERIKYLNLFTREVGKNSTQREIIAQEAERTSNRIAFLFLSIDKMGEVYDGTVVGVTTWGLYVKLDELYCEGLLRIRDLVDDYYVFDEKNFRLVGKRRKKSYGFGSRIKVRIAKVDFEKRQIDLVYEE